jgi:hypothetical protein
MEHDTIKCFFCGDETNINQQDDLKIVVYPKYKRETELDEYQEMFDQWIGDIGKEV